jgi:hypothetical protein
VSEDPHRRERKFSFSSSSFLRHTLFSRKGLS